MVIEVEVGQKVFLMDGDDYVRIMESGGVLVVDDKGSLILKWYLGGGKRKTTRVSRWIMGVESRSHHVLFKDGNCKNLSKCNMEVVHK